MIHIPYFLEDFFQKLAHGPVTFLGALSVSATISTIALFFCGIPICLEIRRRRSTEDISSFPFVMGFLGGAYWLCYGWMRSDAAMITVNVFGVTLMLLYGLFYTCYTRERSSIVAQFGLCVALIIALSAVVRIYRDKAFGSLGLVCTGLNILNFGAPLAGVRVVFEKKCCDTLPLPLCIANFFVALQWSLYGFLVDDVYVLVSNVVGLILALFQLSLFLVFPRNRESVDPLSGCDGSASSDVLKIGDDKSPGDAGMERDRPTTTPPGHVWMAESLFWTDARSGIGDRPLFEPQRGAMKAACSDHEEERRRFSVANASTYRGKCGWKSS